MTASSSSRCWKALSTTVVRCRWRAVRCRVLVGYHRGSHRGVAAYVAPGRVSHREWREAGTPRGPLPRSATTKDWMWRRLHTRAGRAQCDKRKVTVEPVCGQLKTVQGSLSLARPPQGTRRMAPCLYGAQCAQAPPSHKRWSLLRMRRGAIAHRTGRSPQGWNLPGAARRVLAATHSAMNNHQH